MSATFFLAIFVTLLALGTCVLVSVYLFARGWLGNYVSLVENAIVQMAGTVIVVLAVDLVVRLRENAARARVARVGISELAICTNRLVDLFASLIKASSMDWIPQTFEDLFGDTAAELISHRLELARPAPVFPKTTWRDYLARQATLIKDTLDSVQQRYQAFLPEDALERMAVLRGNALLEVLTHLPNVDVLDRMSDIKRPVLNIRLEDLRTPLSEIYSTVKIVEGNAIKYKSRIKMRFPAYIFSRDDIQPKRGDSRFEGEPGLYMIIGPSPPPTH